MTTFSQLIDDMVAETKRTDLKNEMIRYLNQTIREVHSDPKNGSVVAFKSNYQEIQLTADSEDSYVWTLPSPENLQAIAAVRFDNVWINDDERVYAKEIMPGRRLEQLDYAWYRSADQVGFKGYGGLGATISIGYFEFPRRHKYYDVAARPAEYDVDTGWTYLAAYDTDETTRANARAIVSNWILMRWYMLLEEGLRAKVYKRLSDDTRQRTSYSLFMQQRAGLITAEKMEFVEST